VKATHPGTRPRPRARTLARLIRFLGRRSSVTGQAQAGRHPDNYQTEIRSDETETFPGPFRGVIAVVLTGTARTDPIDRQLGGSSRSTRPAAECRTGRVLRCPILLPAPGSRNERTHPSFSLGVSSARARGATTTHHDGAGRAGTTDPVHYCAAPVPPPGRPGLMPSSRRSGQRGEWRLRPHRAGERQQPARCCVRWVWAGPAGARQGRGRRQHPSLSAPTPSHDQSPYS
jgi:hypothetical protein